VVKDNTYEMSHTKLLISIEMFNGELHMTRKKQYIKHMKKVLGIVALVLFVYACSSDDSSTDDQGPTTSSFDRSALLENWADNIIIPGYVDFSSKMATLQDATATFTTSSTDLTAIRAAWLDAYTTWQRVSMFETGPAETVNLRLNVNIFPANTQDIEENIANGSYDLNLSSNRTAKGFPALDYLLYGIAADDASILAIYNGAEGDGYKQYLQDIVTDMQALTTTVLTEWQNGFRDTFVNNNGSSSTASVDRMVNDYIFYYERHLRAGKMGIPGGVFSGSVELNTIEALYVGDLSKQFFLEGLDAVQDFFNGRAYNGNAQGESLASYLDELNSIKDGADLSAIIDSQFNTARQTVQGLGSFEQELQNNPPTTFLNAYDEVQRIVPLLKVDTVSALSISIDFADADGD
jgi:predicted lipoprotein